MEYQTIKESGMQLSAAPLKDSTGVLSPAFFDLMPVEHLSI